ncbi:MAG: dihydropteroate synthase, partial [Paraburkholderia sp.]
AGRGAAILRVHDVAQTVDALKVWAAMRDAARRS